MKSKPSSEKTPFKFPIEKVICNYEINPSKSYFKNIENFKYHLDSEYRFKSQNDDVGNLAAFIGLIISLALLIYGYIATKMPFKWQHILVVFVYTGIISFITYPLIRIYLYISFQIKKKVKIPQFSQDLSNYYESAEYFSYLYRKEKKNTEKRITKLEEELKSNEENLDLLKNLANETSHKIVENSVLDKILEHTNLVKMKIKIFSSYLQIIENELDLSQKRILYGTIAEKFNNSESTKAEDLDLQQKIEIIKNRIVLSEDIYEEESEVKDKGQILNSFTKENVLNLENILTNN